MANHYVILILGETASIDDRCILQEVHVLKNGQRCAVFSHRQHVPTFSEMKHKGEIFIIINSKLLSQMLILIKCQAFRLNGIYSSL